MDLIRNNLGDLLQPISSISLPIIFRPGPSDSTWILTQIFLKLLNFVLPLFIMIRRNPLPNQLRPFRVIPYGLQLLNSPSFLIQYLILLILDRVAQRIEVRYVFYEILASVVLVVMVIFYLLALLRYLLALLQQQLVSFDQLGGRGDWLGLAEEFADLGLSEWSLLGFAGGHERANPQQFG